MADNDLTFANFVTAIADADTFTKVRDRLNKFFQSNPVKQRAVTSTHLSINGTAVDTVSAVVIPWTSTLVRVDGVVLGAISAATDVWTFLNGSGVTMCSLTIDASAAAFAEFSQATVSSGSITAGLAIRLATAGGASVPSTNATFTFTVELP